MFTIEKQYKNGKVMLLITLVGSDKERAKILLSEKHFMQMKALPDFTKEISDTVWSSSPMTHEYKELRPVFAELVQNYKPDDEALI